MNGPSKEVQEAASLINRYRRYFVDAGKQIFYGDSVWVEQETVDENGSSYRRIFTDEQVLAMAKRIKDGPKWSQLFY